MSAAAGRLTNLALLLLLALAFLSGWLAFELAGQPAGAVLVLHAAAGVAIVLLVPWKSLVARRGLRRKRNLKWASLVLAFGIAVSIGFGVLHSAGHPDIGYLTAMDFHVGAAICVIPFLLWHVVARPLKLRVTDLDRRAFLKGGLVTVGAALGVALMPAARRAPTGSFQAADPVATVWMFDSVPVVDVATWRLAVPGREWTYAELVGYTDRTGYSRRFALGDAGRMLLATRMSGSPLDAGHGYPVRLVVPGQRGFAWVKWVAAIEVDDQPWWWQPPFPLQ